MTLNRASWLGWVLVALIMTSLPQRTLPVDEYDANPDALRVDLFNAAVAGDQTLFDSLCRQHASTISKNFESWRKIPAELRADPAEVERYGEHLLAIASYFARRGDRTLIGVFEGTAAKAKMLGWMRNYADAELSLSENRCAEAIAILTPVVDEMRGWMGTSIESLAVRVSGILGNCYRRLQDFDSALKWTYSAYELCVKNEDTDGIITYSGHMAEIYLSRGDDEQFRDWLDATLGVMESAGRDDEARALRAEHAH